MRIPPRSWPPRRLRWPLGLLGLAPLLLAACEDDAASNPDAFLVVRDVGFFEKDGAPPLPSLPDGGGGAVDVHTPAVDQGGEGGGGGGGEGGEGGE
ncbi:hypothetical protein KKB55_15975, partial [Myxococcota bacterium]|nr:hypothetical protein [Myxococcota bacterium]